MPFFQTETSANWCVESCSTQGTGDLILIGAACGYTRFNQGMKVGDYVWYSVTDGANREAGIGLLQTDLIQRTNVTATLVNGVYTEGDGLAPISLSGNSLVASTLNAASYNELWSHIWNTGNPHATSFLDLPDAPNTYAGSGGLFAAVKLSEDGLEFVPGGGAGSGESNTSSNEGAGEGLAMTKVGVNLPFKTLVAGTNITLTPAVNSITIDAAAAGEANAGLNVGTGADVYQTKSGVNLLFRKLSSGSDRLTVSQGANDIIFTVSEANILHQNLNGAGSNTHAQIDAHIASSANPHNVTAAQAGAEPDLGLPATSGYVLSSTTGGVRSWVEMTGGGGGETNTSSNQGAGEGLALPKAGVDLPFKSLVAGSNISLIPGADTLMIAATGAAWGSITGTLSNQTDLQLALDRKVNSDSSGIGGASTVSNIVSLSQAAYDAIPTPDASTLYLITG